MTETETGQAAAQSANGQAPLPPEPEAPDTGERMLGILLLVAAGVFVAMAYDRLTGGRLTAALRGEDASGGE